MNILALLLAGEYTRLTSFTAKKKSQVSILALLLALLRKLLALVQAFGTQAAEGGGRRHIAPRNEFARENYI